MRDALTRVLLLGTVLCLLLAGCTAPAAEIPQNTPAPTAEPTPGPTATPEPTPSPTPAPTAEELLLSEMTPEEKAAQLFFVRCPETGTAEFVAEYQPGGVLLFGRDVRGLTAEQLREKTAAMQSAAKYGLLLGVDEEGGTVVRISSNPNLCAEPYRSPRALYAAGGKALVCTVEADKCRTLRDLGLSVNFAPVCDISASGFMYDRSLGLSPADTADVIAGMVAVYEETGMGCVLKHFPGYGSAADTHTGIVFDDRPPEAFREADFLPFAAGMEAGADCVLASHSIVTCLDAEAPVSLSPAWHEILRDELGFSGVIITDDLAMGAIEDYTDGASAAVAAVLAGNDMLCCSDFHTQYEAVLSALQSGEISEARLDESVLRILRWKAKLGLLG